MKTKTRMKMKMNEEEEEEGEGAEEGSLLWTGPSANHQF